MANRRCYRADGKPKDSFKDRQAAESALKRQQRANGNYALRAYRCAKHKGWHLGTASGKGGHKANW